jgi:hypothetical protein
MCKGMNVYVDLCELTVPRSQIVGAGNEVLELVPNSTLEKVRNVL